MTEANELIHQSLRLRIMAALNAPTVREPTDFVRLKGLVGASDGNLSTHLSTLEGAGYVKIQKDVVGKKPRTRAAITKVGARAFRDHMAYLRELIDASEIFD